MSAPGSATVDAPPVVVAPAARAWGRSGFLGRFRRSRMGMLGLALAVLVLAVTLLPVLLPLDPLAIDLKHVLRAPSLQHPLGTDVLGRDMLARVAYGSRETVLVGLLGVALAMVCGAGLGILSGYLGGVLDSLTMRLVDLLMAFPSMLLAVVVAAVVGSGLKVVVIAICVFLVPNFARLSRATVLSLKERDFVHVARGFGATHLHILRHHILPNCLGPLAVQTSLNAASAILSVSWMSFLGFGAQPPTPELGIMVSDARDVLVRAPWCSIFPGLLITLTVLSLNLIGDGLRDALDTRAT